MRDWHSLAAQLAGSDHLAFIEHNRWVAMPAPPVWDIRDDVATLAGELIESCNRDDWRTGNQIAPNLLWPAALALGYMWRPAAHFRAIELDGESGQDGTPTTYVDLRAACDEIVASWPRLREACARQLQIWPPGPTVWDWPKPHPTAVAVVRLHVSLTRAEPAGELVSLASPLGGHPVDLRRNIAVQDGHGGSKQVTFRTDGRSDVLGTVGRLETANVSARLAFEIFSTCLEFPRSIILLTMLVPKTIALASGVCLRALHDAYYRTAQHEDAQDVWRSLIPLHYLRDDGRWVPAWAHHQQQDPAMLLQR